MLQPKRVGNKQQKLDNNKSRLDNNRYGKAVYTNDSHSRQIIELSNSNNQNSVARLWNEDSFFVISALFRKGNETIWLYAEKLMDYTGEIYIWADEQKKYKFKTCKEAELAYRKHKDNLSNTQYGYELIEGSLAIRQVSYETKVLL